MPTTSFNIFAANGAIRAAYGTGADTHSVLNSAQARASASLHLATDATVSLKKFPLKDGLTERPFAAVQIACPSGPSEVAVFVTPEELDAAVALRDALTQAIAFVRKAAKE